MADKQEQMSWREVIAFATVLGFMVVLFVIPHLFWAMVSGQLKPRQIWQWVKVRDYSGALDYALDRLEPNE